MPHLQRFAKPYRVRNGRTFRLKDVPPNHKRFTRLVVVAAVIDALEEMQLAFPSVDRDKRKELAAVRRRLEDERGR